MVASQYFSHLEELERIIGDWGFDNIVNIYNIFIVWTFSLKCIYEYLLHFVGKCVSLFKTNVMQ